MCKLGLGWSEIVQRLEERYPVEELIEVLELEDWMDDEFDYDDLFNLEVTELCKIKVVKNKIKHKIEELDIL